MEVKNGVATATMTDLKNLIGDVFELVDKHGKVEITSYGKTKYVIQKHTADTKGNQASTTQNNTKSKTAIKTQPTPTEVNLSQQQTVTTPETIDANVSNDTKEKQDLHKLEEEKLNKLSKLIHIPNLTITWDRENDLEQEWVQTARDLL